MHGVARQSSHFDNVGQIPRVLPVDIPSMADTKDENEQSVIMYGVDDAEVTHADTPQISAALQFLNTTWPWVAGQGIDGTGHTATVSYLQP
jgi:hypothetical protein